MEQQLINFENFLNDLPISTESTCSYFENKSSRVKAFISEKKLPQSLLESALFKGYRRSGTFYYKTECQKCQLCIPYRLNLKDFKLSKSQKRVRSKNSDLIVKVCKPKLDEVKEFLYLRYQHQQHFDKTEEFNAAATLKVMHEQMYSFTDSSVELELWYQNKLITFGILDLDSSSISAVYSVYDPDYYTRSLGSMFIIASIQWALAQGLEYYYLGFYIPHHQKMDYKANFKPAEILQNGQWINFNKDDFKY